MEKGAMRTSNTTSLKKNIAIVESWEHCNFPTASPMRLSPVPRIVSGLAIFRWASAGCDSSSVMKRADACDSLTHSRGSRTVEKVENKASNPEYKPGIFDDLLLNLFRNKLVEEVGWDSEKHGYDGLIEVANHLMMKGRKNSDTVEAAVRILRSLFPPLLLELYRMLITPLGGGKIAAMMVARVTALTCQWLMGPCKVNSVDLPDGTPCSSGVFVERCKYLEESKCVGICINTCKFPTQDHMGVPLFMEPNFSDYSCQFKFGVLPPLPEDDSILKEPCLEACPNTAQRRAASCPTA